MKNGCFSAADILLPRSGFEEWAVIACDQYTSEPEYWEEVKRKVGDKPSALKLILPEVYLEEDNSESLSRINGTMEEYLSSDIFECFESSLIYTERTQGDGRVRRGIIGKISLQCYDYREGFKGEIRATEKTVLERIPPRVKIRENAPLELPHIMLLADDRDDLLFGYLSDRKNEFEKLYDFRLMQNGGHIKGWLLDERAAEYVDGVLEALKRRGEGLLFCVGDGNHSLAAAKAAYEEKPDSISEYALAEVVNIHDSALDFKPIYRAVFGAEPERLIELILSYAGGEYTGDGAHKFTCVFDGRERSISLAPTAELPVGTLQRLLDRATEEIGVKTDYIHGEASLLNICRKKNTVGFLFDGMKKAELFKAVSADGALPRKTFSMGHADDKRFYLEARKIRKY